VTLPVYKVPAVFLAGLGMDSFTLIPSASGSFFGEILDMTFNPARDAVAGGYHVRVREVYWSNQEAGMKVKRSILLPRLLETSGFPCASRRLFMNSTRMDR
jgi:hypothetical protein